MSGSGNVYLLPINGPAVWEEDRTGDLYPSDITTQQAWKYPPPISTNTVTTATYGLDGAGVICVDGTSTYASGRIYAEAGFLGVLTTDDVVRCKNGDVYYDTTVSSVDTTNGFFVVPTTGTSVYLNADATLQIITMPYANSLPAVIDLVSTANMGLHAHRTDLGYYPFICTADWDHDSLSLCHTELTGRTYASIFTARDWSVTERISVKAYLRDDLKLIGYYAGPGANGAIAFYPVEPDTDNAVTLTDDSIVLTEGMGIAHRRNSYGIVNAIEYIDRYAGQSQTYNILTTNSPYYKARGLNVYKISPRTQNISAFDPIAHTSVFLDFEGQVLAYLNSDYMVITLRILSSLRDTVNIGTWLAFTSSHILDYSTGEFGVSGRTAMVVGRSFSLDPNDGASGTITAIISRNAGKIKTWVQEDLVTSLENVFGIEYYAAESMLYFCNYDAWTTYPHSCIQKISISGGTITTIVTGGSAHHMTGVTVDDTYVYFRNNTTSKVGRCAHDGTSLNAAWNGSSNYFDYFLCNDSTYVYITKSTTSSLIYHIDKSSATGTVIQTIPTGGTPGGNCLSDDESTLYYLAEAGIESVPTDDGDPITTIVDIDSWSAFESPECLGNWIYYPNYSENAIVRYSTDGVTEEEVVTLSDNPTEITGTVISGLVHLWVAVGGSISSVSWNTSKIVHVWQTYVPS